MNTPKFKVTIHWKVIVPSYIQPPLPLQMGYKVIRQPVTCVGILVCTIFHYPYLDTPENVH